jgi:hypothetical protein
MDPATPSEISSVDQLPPTFVQQLQNHAAADYIEVTLADTTRWVDSHIVHHTGICASLYVTMPHSLPDPLTLAPAANGAPNNM